MTFEVRTEQPVDTGQILEVTKLAFSTAAHTNGQPGAFSSVGILGCVGITET